MDAEKCAYARWCRRSTISYEVYSGRAENGRVRAMNFFPLTTSGVGCIVRATLLAMRSVHGTSCHPVNAQTSKIFYPATDFALALNLSAITASAPDEPPEMT